MTKSTFKKKAILLRVKLSFGREETAVEGLDAEATYRGEHVGSIVWSEGRNPMLQPLRSFSRAEYVSASDIAQCSTERPPIASIIPRVHAPRRARTNCFCRDMPRIARRRAVGNYQRHETTSKSCAERHGGETQSMM